MVAKKRTPVIDGRKPKHSLDAGRPTKGGKGRDAATVCGWAEMTADYGGGGGRWALLAAHAAQPRRRRPCGRHPPAPPAPALQVRRLKMYKTKARRDAKGKIVHEDLQSKELPSTRIQPDRRWFGNTRVVGARQLDQFRQDMAAKAHDGYSVLLRQKKLPLALLAEPAARDGAKATLLAAQPFAATFGSKATRKRPRLTDVDGYGDLVGRAEVAAGGYEKRAPTADAAAAAADGASRPAARDAHYDKGQSKRIWAELYKVLDSSDVVVQVLDARDPAGTRCKFLEDHLKANARHKHLILLLNKCDLVRRVGCRGKGVGPGGPPS